MSVGYNFLFISASSLAEARQNLLDFHANRRALLIPPRQYAFCVEEQFECVTLQAEAARTVVGPYEGCSSESSCLGYGRRTRQGVHGRNKLVRRIDEQ